jgi:hypothetical protein
MAHITDRPSTRIAVLWTCDILQTIKMKRIANWLILGALLVGAPVASGAQQTIAKRDSVIADSLARLRPYLSTGRDRNKADSLARVLRQPMPVRVDTIRRVDTVTVVRVDTVRVPVDTAKPPPIIIPPPPADTSVVAKIAGPFLSSAQQLAMGEPFAEYDRQFSRFDEPQWLTIGTWPISYANYYDRALAYYVRWRQTGDAKYRVRADSMARDYRKRYVEAAGYLTAWNNAMTSGMAIHYLVTGDTMSRLAVGHQADVFAWFPNISTTDNRVQGYILKTLLDARLINAPSTSVNGLPAAGDWSVALRAKLTAILATQAADGAWRKTDCGDGLPLTVHPFTTGILLDQMTRYYDTFEKDPRILPAVKKAADYLWTFDWIATANAFKYVERVCPSEGGPNPAPILNGLLVNAYAWLYEQTGDATYKTRATAMIVGAVASGEAGTNPKQFAEMFATSARALYRLRR